MCAAVGLDKHRSINRPVFSPQVSVSVRQQTHCGTLSPRLTQQSQQIIPKQASCRVSRNLIILVLTCTQSELRASNGCEDVTEQKTNKNPTFIKTETEKPISLSLSFELDPPDRRGFGLSSGVAALLSFSTDCFDLLVVYRRRRDTLAVSCNVIKARPEGRGERASNVNRPT